MKEIESQRSLREYAPGCVEVLDQRLLPHRVSWMPLRTAEEAAYAIRDMVVRGAPLIGVTAAWGMYLAACAAPEQGWQLYLETAATHLRSTRPTAVNLAWALEQQLDILCGIPDRAAAQEALLLHARHLTEADAETCRQIGLAGLPLIEAVWKRTGRPVQILTHCNAGRLACVAWGTATAPIYLAHTQGIPLHVWVDETRPRNQGASLTAWELGQAGVPHTLIPDNAGGHLMQHGKVDLCIVGSDRTTRTGDVANKIGTYLKALAAQDNGVPFYVALPGSSFDPGLEDGVREIEIETRSADEVHFMHGLLDTGETARVRISPAGTPAVNYGFDVTPARLVTGLITERGLCPATERGIVNLFPEWGPFTG